MFILQFFAKLVKILRSAAEPGEIAGGFVLGMIIGLTPLWSLHNLLVVLIIIILNVNISMAIFSFALFSGFAYILDPLFHDFGYFLLVDLESLRGMYRSLYSIPIVALSNFNNTVVMGSLVSSLILIAPMHIAVKKGVIAYRERIEARVQKMKIVQVLKGSRLYGWYEKLSQWRG